MIRAARDRVSDGRCRFTAQARELEPASYTVASGIFNVKLEADDGAWERYVESTLETMARLSSDGFAFNMLTRFADAELMRTDLYYGDPMHYFALCKERYSRYVALLHDYELFEFTVLVRLGTPPKPFVRRQ